MDESYMYQDTIVTITHVFFIKQVMYNFLLYTFSPISFVHWSGIEQRYAHLPRLDAG